MASSIDDTKPAQEAALLSQPIRDNFVAAKEEIEILQDDVITNASDIADNVTNIAAILLQNDMVNLVIKNGGTPDEQVDIDADNLQVEDVPLEDIDLTVANVGGTGANLLDTGVVAANTWYFIWVIYKPSTSTVAGLLSISSTSPTMPADYTKKRLVGAVTTDATSDFVGFSQVDRFVVVEEVLVLFQGTSGPGFNAIDLSDVVPTTAKKVEFYMTANGTTGTTASGFIASTGAGLGKKRFSVAVSTTNVVINGYLSTAVVEPQTIYYGLHIGDNISIRVSEWQY